MITFHSLVIFVEGADDRIFFEAVIVPELKNNYHTVEIKEHAKEKDSKINNYIKSIDRTSTSDYIFLIDINNKPCITKAKQVLFSKYPNIDPDKIFIVIKMIEGWYLSGLDKDSCLNLNITINQNIEEINKILFDSLIPSKFKDSSRDFKKEVLNNFSIDEAKENNQSFKYFVEKFLP